MGTLDWKGKIEAYFDGERGDEALVREWLATRPECAAYLAELERLRAGAQSVVRREEIGDGQFSAFLDGIREGISDRPHGHRGLWAIASLTAAAVVIASATIYIFSGGPVEVKATEVEQVSTELDASTVEWQDPAEGASSTPIDM